MAKTKLDQQKNEIEKVKKVKQDLQESMKSYKADQDKRRKDMHDRIEKQKQ